MAALGLLLLVLAGIAGMATALANSGSDHLVNDFSVFGFDAAASSGRVFLYGAAIGAVGMLGLDMFLTGLGKGLKNRARNRRELKAERSRNESLAQERERLAHELDDERSSSVVEGEIDLTQSPASRAPTSHFRD